METIQTPAESGPVNFFALLLIAAAVYLALGALGISFAIDPGYASPVFPAAGFAVAILLHSGKRTWPAIWLGSLALNLGLAWLHDDAGWRSALLAAGIASGATLQAVAAWGLVRRGIGNGWQTLENERDIIRCLALAGPVACAISASIGVGLLYSTHVISSAELAYAWWNWWAGDTLGVLVVLPLGLAALYWRRSPWRGRLTTLVLPMLLILVLVGAAFIAVARWEREQQKTIIQSHGETLAQLLEQRFIAHQEALSALRRLVEVNPGMSYRQFEHFTRITLHDNPDLFALSFNPLVTLRERPSFERVMAIKSALPSYEIKERDSQRGLIRAADRADYVAVAFIAPLEGNRPALGYDISSEPVRQDAIRRALRSGEPAVTTPIQLVQENKKRLGVLLLHPVRQAALDANASENTVTGFAIGVIKLDEMIEIATRPATVPGLVFRLDDGPAATDKTAIYTSDAAASASDSPYLWRKDLAMADRTWTLSVFPTAGFLLQQHHFAALAVGTVGLLLAALLQILLLVTTGKTTIVRRRVREQTEQLHVKSDALEDRNAQLDALFSLCPDGFVAFAHDGRVKFVNPAFASMTGIDQENIVSRNEAALDDELRQRCENPERYTAIATYFAPSQESLVQRTLNLKIPRQCVLQMVGIRSESSGISRILYFRDVTHETEVDQMKSEFLSTAAHELRTPMASIYGFAEVLLAGDLDAESSREFLEIIFKQSELMSSILNELLDLARIEARRGKDFVIKATPAQALVSEVVNGFKLPAGRAAPTLLMPEAPIYVMADPQKARQAILNVLSNAYKYSPAGSAVSIAIDPPPVGESAQPMVAFRLVDQGIGMSPVQLARVFERFYRANTSGEVPGTGLGMSIVHEIVGLHGGQVVLDSAFGQGTTVTIRLPAAMAPNQTPAFTSTPESAGSSRKPS